MPGIVVTPVVMILEEKFPGLHVNVLRIEWDSRVEVLHDGRADVSLVRLPVPLDGLTIIPLYTEPKVAVLPVDHPLLAVPDLRIADLAEYELLQPPDAVPEWRDAVALLYPGRDRSNIPITHTVEEKLEQVAAHRGLAILPSSTASYYVRPDIICRPIADSLPSEVAIAFETDHRTSYVEAFISVAGELIPHPAKTMRLGAFVQQPFARVPAVDEPEVGRRLVEAEQFLEALRQLADLARIGAEGVCLAGAEPRLRVVDDNPEPGGGACVGAGAVPQPSGEEQHGSGRHFHRDGVARRGFPLCPPVAARDYAGGPVVGGEVTEGPDGGHHDVTVARERVDALFVVQHLRVLARMDLGGVGEAELRARSDELLYRIQHDRVECGLVHAPGPGQQRPYPARPGAVEA